MRFLEIVNQKNKINKEKNLLIMTSYIKNEGNYNEIIKDIKWTAELKSLQSKTQEF